MLAFSDVFFMVAVATGFLAATTALLQESKAR